MSALPARGPLWPFGAFNAAYFAFGGVFMAYLPLYLGALRFSVLKIGVLLAIMQALRIIGPNLWGWVADHATSRARVLRTMAVISLAAFLPLFVVRDPPAVFAVLIVLSFFNLGIVPVGEP